VKRVLSLAFALVLLSQPAWALLELDGKFVQGGMVTGRVEPAATVALDGAAIPVRGDGRFFLGFGRDQGATAALVVTHPDGYVDRVALEIEQRAYDIQRIDGLPDQMVTPDAATLARIADDRKAVEAARAIDSDVPFFDQGFVWPAIGPVSGVYGSQRILNGEPRQPHFGVDIAAPEGTPVGAAAAGTVTLAKDLYFTGNTVIIDHGYGVSTTYSHLKKMLVAVGDKVNRQQEIGELGATGRATGAHLDWRLNLFDVRLDPALVVDEMPTPATAESGTPAVE
jgi:murein DD-endopeptidase MepM/ murein hydrolase activator NlpD